MGTFNIDRIIYRYFREIFLMRTVDIHIYRFYFPRFFFVFCKMCAIYFKNTFINHLKWNWCRVCSIEYEIKIFFIFRKKNCFSSVNFSLFFWATSKILFYNNYQNVRSISNKYEWLNTITYFSDRYLICFV